MDGITGTATASQPTDIGHATVDVREEVADQVRAVADTAQEQTRSVLSDIGGEISHQVAEQQHRLAAGIRDISDELDQAATNGTGTVADVAGEVASRTRQVSGWLEQHEPADVVHSVEEFARRRPLVFLLGAAAAGALVGRVTRNALAARKQSSGSPDPAGGQQVAPGEIPPIGGDALAGHRTSVQASDPHLTGEPADAVLLGEPSGPLTQRAHDPESAYPNNDQPPVEVGDELPTAGTRIGQGRRDDLVDRS